jgi:hypothetical protein
MSPTAKSCAECAHPAAAFPAGAPASRFGAPDSDTPKHLAERFDAERGEVHYRKALALAEPRGMRPLVAHCHLGLGELYGRLGEQQEAQDHLATATIMYREMDMWFWLEQAEAELKELA